MSLNPINPSSLIMTEYTSEDEINENNVKRYLTSTVRVAKEECCEYCRNMLMIACCINTICFGTVFCCIFGQGVSLTAALTTAGICSLGCTCCICLGPCENEYDCDDHFKYRYFEQQTTLISKFSKTSEIVHKIMKLEVPHDQIMTYVKYGILSENTARNYEQLFLNKNKLEKEKSKILKKKNKIEPKVILNASFTNIEVVINNISLDSSKNELLKNPDYQTYVEKLNILNDRMQTLEINLHAWEENKNNLIEQLKHELPILDQNDGEINLCCYSFFCKDKF